MQSSGTAFVWSVQTTPSPVACNSYLDSYLYGVTCPSAAACFGVGQYVDSAGTLLTLAELSSG